MGKMPTDSLGKSSEIKLHCFCLFDAYSMPKYMCGVPIYFIRIRNIWRKGTILGYNQQVPYHQV